MVSFCFISKQKHVIPIAKLMAFLVLLSDSEDSNMFVFFHVLWILQLYGYQIIYKTVTQQQGNYNNLECVFYH